MNIEFKWIAILGYPRNEHLFFTHQILYNWLKKKGYNVVIEYSISKFVNIKSAKIFTFVEIGEQCDLGIVIGGDGNMLYVSRMLSSYPIKLIGINCGNLGFLTDLQPKNMFLGLFDILSGNFFLEKRFLLEVSVENQKIKKKSVAVNEVMISSIKKSYMMSLKVYLDNQFAFYQRSDGIMISTPTGSTGYYLSAGGAILSPTSEVISIISILPHTLSSRPIIINNNTVIMIKLFNSENNFEISCDSQVILPIKHENKIFIYKSKYYINLIHPKSYHYLKVLRKKLDWFKNFF
ncbi:NAD(+)/NADH kinase [Buchnera aphidicola]|uniref:NAD(+)/NADH kinase n=1 Tax=Buchnera aphidicola TaxID=9 RepID=UPI0034647B4E